MGVATFLLRGCVHKHIVSFSDMGEVWGKGQPLFQEIVEFLFNKMAFYSALLNAKCM